MLKMFIVTQYRLNPEGTWIAKNPNISGMNIMAWLMDEVCGSASLGVIIF